MHIVQPLIARLTVLVADDERVIADTLALILRQNGFDSVSIYSGEAALAAAEAKRPDALVVDVLLNGMSGIETARRIRELYPDCKTILMSGTGATSDLVSEADSLGEGVSLLAKPFPPDELLAKLRA